MTDKTHQFLVKEVTQNHPFLAGQKIREIEAAI